ncbi:MAG: molybdenum ABC transporter ATP-binding protein [Rhodobacterales bacterium]|nr:MAG: molybdenum ABC transporter ATP-binding protein [Rhodobacterales bacterium]
MGLKVDIAHDFGGFALRVAFEAGPGVTALFGASGSGKSSVVKAVAGLLRPDRGRIVVGDTTFSDAGVFLPPHKRGVAVVFQDARLFPHMDVAANLRFGARMAGRLDKGEERRVCDMLGLGDLLTRRPAGLSGGEASRVALGRALLMRPQVLLLDEPLAALDAARKEEILPCLERLRDEVGLPILLVSHDLGEVARLADQLVILRDGAVVRTGAVDAVLSDPEMVPYLGVREAGGLLHVKVAEHSADGLTLLAFSGGDIWVPRVARDVGAAMRLRIPARDIILATERPSGLSVRNILEVRIEDIRMGAGPGAAVSLRVGQDRLLARITARAVTELGLQPGTACFAIIKATSVPRSYTRGQGVPGVA